MAKTSIEWTDATWNPTRGCSKVSAGCANCFAERMAARFCGPGQPYEGLILDGHWVNGARFVPEMLDAPLRWKQPRRVFVNSMSDLFHENNSDEQIAAVFGVMAVAATKFFGEKPTVNSQRCFGPHTFQILTKRAERLRLLGSSRFRELVARAAYRYAMDRVDAGWLSQCISGRREPGNHCTLDEMWPLPNVQLIVSCEDQATANERIPLLLRCPAAVRGVSLEPLLGPVDLTNITAATPTGPEQWDVLSDDEYDDEIGGPGPHLNWVIVGGESGPGTRPMHPAWARSIRDQCMASGVPFFFKQWGTWAPGYDENKFTFGRHETPARAQPWLRDDGESGHCWVYDDDGTWQNHTGDPGGDMSRVTTFHKHANAEHKAIFGHLLDGRAHKMYPGDKWL